MSHQWLYPIFRVYGYRPTKVETVEHCLRLHLTPQPHQVCCSQCGNREVIRRGEQVRVLRNLPVGGIVSLLLIPDQDSSGRMPRVRRRPADSPGPGRGTAVVHAGLCPLWACLKDRASKVSLV